MIGYRESEDDRVPMLKVRIVMFAAKIPENNKLHSFVILETHSVFLNMICKTGPGVTSFQPQTNPMVEKASEHP